jgi:hypothetical protein
MRWQKRAIKGNKKKVFIALSAPFMSLVKPFKLRRLLLIS